MWGEEEGTKKKKKKGLGGGQKGKEPRGGERKKKKKKKKRKKKKEKRGGGGGGGVKNDAKTSDIIYVCSLIYEFFYRTISSRISFVEGRRLMLKHFFYYDKR